MKTVTLSVANRQAVKQRGLDAFSGKRRGAHISFASADLLWLTAKRWQLLKALRPALARAISRAERRVLKSSRHRSLLPEN